MTQQAIQLTLMTVDEARACVDSIKSSLEDVRAQLFDLREREGWRALGFASFRECIHGEFAMSERRAHQLVNAHMVDRVLAPAWQESQAFFGKPASGDPGTIVQPQSVAVIPESHARELAPLIAKPETLRQVYREVQDRTGGHPTAAAIREVAAELAAPESPFHPDHPSNAAPAFEMPEQEQETEEERAYFLLARQRLVARYVPGAVAATPTDPTAALPAWEEFERWFSEFMLVLRARASHPIRLAK